MKRKGKQLLTAASLMDAIYRANIEIKSRAAAFFDDFTRHGPERLAKFGPLEPIEGAAGYSCLTLWKGWYAVLCNPLSSIWVFAWVAKSREEACRWARTHRIEANPRIRAIQMFEEPEDAVPASASGKGSPLFSKVSDGLLLDLGVPVNRLELVRSLCSADELEQKGRFLPSAVEKRLWKIVQGTPASALVSHGVRPTATEAGYLGSAATRSAFYAPADKEDFSEILRMPLDKWRCYLSEEQRQLVEADRNGPFMVVGSAGTGKTVVALHRAKRLVELPDWGPKDRLLFTTFTRNLALDLRLQMEKLLPAKVIERTMDIVNLDEWVRNFLVENHMGREYLLPGPELDAIWAGARRLFPARIGNKPPMPESFYRNEFEQVVLPDNIRSEAAYLLADRRGRGVTLGKRERSAVWPVLAYVRRAIDDTGKLTPSDAYNTASALLMSGRSTKQYRAVILDEAQDFGREAFRLLRQLTPDLSLSNSPGHPRQGDIFIVGDENQRIYSRGSGYDLKRCGINVRSKRTRKLTINYRTTADIRSAALVVLEHNRAKVLESKLSRRPYRDEECVSTRRGPEPVLYVAHGLEDEAGWIADRIFELQNQDRSYVLSDFVVAAHSRERRDEYARCLAARGLATAAIEAAETPARDAVRVSTLHRLKGLEFKVVFIAGADAGKIPSDSAVGQGSDKMEKAGLYKRQRSLFYVAVTRARDRLFISCRERPGAFMAAVADYLSR